MPPKLIDEFGVEHLMNVDARKSEHLMSRQSACARFNQLIKLIGNQNIYVLVAQCRTECKSKIVSFVFNIYTTGHRT